MIVIIGCESHPYSALPVVRDECVSAMRDGRPLPPPPAPTPGAIGERRGRDWAWSAGTKHEELPPDMIEGHRISGSIVIVPDDDTKRAIAYAGIRRIAPVLKLCLDTSGVPVVAEIERSSCFPRYDSELVDGVLAWRYRPYEKDGSPVRVCTRITFVYSQRLRP